VDLPTDEFKSLSKSTDAGKGKKRRGAEAEEKKSADVKRAHSEGRAANKKTSKVPDVVVPTSYEDSASHYYRKEPWTEDFPVKDFMHFVKKGHARADLQVLQDFSQWKWLYHCQGPWQAEQLVYLLNSQGTNALVIKRKRGGADQEVYSFKVVAGDQDDVCVGQQVELLPGEELLIEVS
jgi:hypothetical protein